MNFSEDLFYELSLFLDRNEVERNQLVSKTWHNLILKKSSFLPLRLVDELKFEKKYENHEFKGFVVKVMVKLEDKEKILMDKNQDSRAGLDENGIRSLKYCVIKKLNTEMLTPEPVLKILQKINLLTEKKLEVLYYDAFSPFSTFSDDYRAEPEPYYTQIPEILQYLDLKTLHKAMNDIEVEIFFSNSIKIPKPPAKIKMFYSESELFYDDVETGKISEKLFNLIQSGELNGASRFSIKMRLMTGFYIRKLLDLYMDALDASKLPKSIRTRCDEDFVGPFKEFIEQHRLVKTSSNQSTFLDQPIPYFTDIFIVNNNHGLKLRIKVNNYHGDYNTIDLIKFRLYSE